MRFCLNIGEPLSNKTIIHKRINIGNNNINPRIENNKSNKRIIRLEPFVLYPL